MALMLLHGFTGSALSFRHLPFGEVGLAPQSHAREVPRGRVGGAGSPVVTPTLPGHGGQPAPTSFESVIDDLARLLDGPSIIHGYSQGARLALALAVRHPHLVEHLSLESGSPGLADEHERAQRRASDEKLAQRILAIGTDAFLTEWDAQPLLSTRRVPYPRVHAPEGLASALRVMGTGAQPSYWDALPSLRMAVHLITGALDEKFTAIARRMHALIPHSHHTVIPECGHAPHLEQPHVVARLIQRRIP